MSAHKGDVLTTTTIPAYEMMKQRGVGEKGGGKEREEGERAGERGGRGGEGVGRGQGSHEYEVVGVSPGTGPPIAKAADKTKEMLSPPLSHHTTVCSPHPLVEMWVWLRKGRKRVLMTTFQKIDQ